MGLYYDNMCSGTDFTHEKSNFQPTTEIPNSYSYSLTLKYPFFLRLAFCSWGRRFDGDTGRQEVGGAQNLQFPGDRHPSVESNAKTQTQIFKAKLLQKNRLIGYNSVFFLAHFLVKVSPNTPCCCYNCRPPCSQHLVWVRNNSLHLLCSLITSLCSDISV